MKTGDVVRLKSGGPQMTVNQILNIGHVECFWFDDNDNHMWGNFAPEALELVDES